MPRIRTLASLLLVATAGFALAGCSLLTSTPHPSPAPSVTSDAPAAGECWNGTVADAGAWSDWRGAAPTPCSATHTLYTFAVVKIPGLLPTQWAKSATDPSLSDVVAAAASTACEAPLAKTLPGLAWNEQLISNFFFVPTEAQWKKGERWVRCDLGVLDYGTTFKDERFVPLPTIDSLATAVATEPGRFTLCVDTPAVAPTKGPYPDKGDVITDCRANPQWGLVLTGAMSGGSKAPYPSSRSINADLTAVCDKSISGPTEIWRGYYPTKSQWAVGDREIDCWVSPKRWTSSTGTST